MSAVSAEVIRRHSLASEGLAFAAQMLIAVSVEVGDDVGRGFFSQHGTPQGIADARQVVSFEAAHGFWVEPAWQLFFQHTHHFLAFTLTWPNAARLMNGVYIGGHIFVTLGVALWLYFCRRKYFALWRNTLILANALALFVYESFPVAPPRLTTNLIFNHHLFTFQDTVFGLLQSGQKFVGTSGAGYNEFSAMPSVHMAWALLAGLALVLLARPVWAKAFGVVYPIIMLVAVVVTGNHYLLDAVGAAFVLVGAFFAALIIERYKSRIQWPWRGRQPSPVGQ